MSQSRWGAKNGTVEPQILQAEDVAIVAVGWVQGLVQVTSNSLSTLEILLRAHANAKRDSSEFAGSVQLGLDQLCGGDS